MRRIAIVTAAAAAVPLALSAQACDPQRAAMEIFSKQGLVLLKPARSYVEIGALVIQPKSGQPRYIDPMDAVPSQDKPSIDFDAVLLAETQQRRTSIGTALTFISTIVPMPIGLKVDSSREVTLSQVDSKGVRLKENALESLIKKKNTADKLRQQLTAGRKAYVIQEVYRAASLSVSATSATSLGATLGGAELPTCSAAGTGDADKSKAKEDKDGKKEEKTDEKTDEKQPAAATPPAAVEGTAGAEKPADAGKPSGAGGDAGQAAAQAGAAAPNAETPTPKIGACYANAGKTILALKSTKPLPFAVRLAEIELVNGQLQVKIGNFKFPTGLGSSEIEKTTALPGKTPVIEGLVRER